MPTPKNKAAAKVIDSEPWIHRSFPNHKGKLRVRERYWRATDNAKSGDDSPGSLLLITNAWTVIPEGIVWRKYHTLLQELSSLLSRDDVDFENETPKLRLVLLESAAELLDWRHSSPCIGQPKIVHDNSNSNAIDTQSIPLLRPEAAAQHERIRLRTLVQQHNVVPYCDLSLRMIQNRDSKVKDDVDDEWSFLSYETMSVMERSRHALVRAGNMWRWQCRGNADTDHEETVILLVEDKAVYSNAKDVLMLTVDGLLEYLRSEYCLTAASMEPLWETKRVCDETYARRNNMVNGADESDDTTVSREELSDDAIQDGVRNGRFMTGRLDVTKSNAKEAYVKTSSGMRLFIDGRKGHYSHAFHQDIVVVEPLPESQWGKPVGRRRLMHQQNAGGDDEEEADKLGNTVGFSIPSARVVSIRTQSRRTFVATMVDQPVADERAILVIPMDVRIPKIRVKTRDWQRLVNQRLLISVDDWEIESNYPTGHFVRSLGAIGDLETEIVSLLYEHEIELEPFSVSALASLPPAGRDWKVSGTEIQLRRDLRNSHRIFSVDPPGCQDIDDTMHARVLSNGDIEVGVHIADVTHFVRHNSSLDREAQVRGTTFYLVDRRFDMLPSLLSSDLCSLHGDKDRLAVSVIWTMSPDLEEIKSSWCGRTVIHNCQAMTYEQAHNILHGTPPDDPRVSPPPPLTAGAPVDPRRIQSLKADLTILQTLARKLRRDREMVGGAVDLSSGDLGTELKFSLDENGNPTKVTPKEEKEIHHTIAEMMIFANSYVASKIFERFPQSALLRIHRTVEQSRFEDLETALKVAGIKFDGTSNTALAKSLSNAKQTGKSGALVNALWQSLATRAMSEALYVCTGSKGDNSVSHYGLGIDKYTHFTSPIRRYADIVVHKQLLAALAQDMNVEPGLEEPKFTRPELSSLPDSSAISVLQGEGLRTSTEPDPDPDAILDSLVEGATESVLGTRREASPSTVPEMDFADATPDQVVPYAGNEVEQICDGLNRQNRLSKQCSMDCQRLFLSLFFRDHVETAQGVVIDTRSNGLLVYVPKFDLKGPAYLSDQSGDLQIDPALLGLPPDSGFEPTVGFSAAPGYRRFPSGVCELKEPSDNGTSVLEVKVPGWSTPCIFRTLDVVTVQLSCDVSDVRARVPPPRLHLLSSSARPTKFGRTSPEKVVSTMITSPSTARTGQDKCRTLSVPPGFRGPRSPRTAASIYEELSSIRIEPNLPDVPIRRRKSSNVPDNQSTTTPIIPGRLVFGGFVNPDTRSATQEAAQAAASKSAAQRRSQARTHEARRKEYDTSLSMERSATARMQRIAADKRHTRRSNKK